jgi:hypothetical protein
MPAVPFKLNQDRRHHIPRQQHRVTNWRAYEASLRERGSLTVWFADDGIAAWAAEPRTTRGGQAWYSPLTIMTALTLRAARRLAYRQADGLIGSIISLLDQIAGPLSSFAADGAYDQDGVYAAVADRHPEAAVIVPPRRTAALSDMAAIAPTQRDRHLRCIAESSRRAWQKATGYDRRAKVEAAIGRRKQVIGDGLRSV